MVFKENTHIKVFSKKQCLRVRTELHKNNYLWNSGASLIELTPQKINSLYEHFPYLITINPRKRISIGVERISGFEVITVLGNEQEEFE